MLSKFLIQFSADGWSCVPCLSLAWGQTMIGVMAVLATSFERTYASIVVCSAPDYAAGHCQPMPPPETPGQSQASLAQSLVGSLSFLLGSGAHKVFCALQESVSPVLWKFCNQIPLAFKFKFLAVLLPMRDLQVGKSAVDPTTFTTVTEVLWYNCFPVCGSSAQ